MTTGYEDDDADDKQSTHAPPNAHYPPNQHYTAHHPPHHHANFAPHYASSPSHADSEAKCKQDADTGRHPLDPLPRSLLPAPSPPQPYATDYKEEKQQTNPLTQSHAQQAASAGQLYNPLPPHGFRPLFLHEWLDVCDTDGSWLEAQVQDVSATGTHIKVHYKGYKAKYDEWLDTSLSHPHAARIAPLHRYTRPKWPLPDWPVVPLTVNGELATQLPVAVDCLDTTDKWLPAHITQYDTQHHYALVSYDGWSVAYNEWLNFGTYRLAPARTHTTATASKFVNVTNHITADAAYQHDHSLHPHYKAPSASVPQPLRYSASVDNETRFRLKLGQLGLSIVAQEQDGNCLFRSISHQLYDSGDCHRLVRETCMRYIDTDAAYFRAFVVGDFDAYVARMRQPGEWGDHLEIQALSEVYDMPIEIYAYSTHPLRTYSREDGSEGLSVGGVRRPVMRLSYHFASHYNSVVEAGRPGGLLEGRHVGEVEEESMERQRRRREERLRREREERAESEQEDALQRSLRMSRSQFGQASSVSEFDGAVAASLREMNVDEERKVEEVKRESEREAVERDEMELVMQQSVQDDMQHEIEQAELNTALQHSLSSSALQATAATTTAHATHSPPTAPADDEEEELRRAMQLSLQAAHSSSASTSAALASGSVGGGAGLYPSAVQKLMDLGFPFESCVSAYSMFEGGGESEEVLLQNMMEYILAQRS